MSKKVEATVVTKEIRTRLSHARQLNLPASTQWSVILHLLKDIKRSKAELADASCVALK